MKLILMAFAILLLTGSVYGQLTAGEWSERGRDLVKENKYDAAVNAYDEAIKLVLRNINFAN
jgi:hypothetical protein